MTRKFMKYSMNLVIEFCCGPLHSTRQKVKHIIKPWIGPYIVKAKLGRVGYEIDSEVGQEVVRVHENRPRKIVEGVLGTVKPEDGMFPDSLRTFSRISDVQNRVH